MPISTDDLKDLPHVVIVEDHKTLDITEFEGEGCMEKAHEHGQRRAMENRDAKVMVCFRIRTITGPGWLEHGNG
jgi:hypothetical protein